MLDYSDLCTNSARLETLNSSEKESECFQFD